MITLTSTRVRRVSLVIKLTDIVTGDTIIGGRDIKLISCDGLYEPVAKPDGYFVFTDNRPEKIKIKSKAYRGAVIDTREHKGGVLRFALVPRRIEGNYITVPEGSYIGFQGGGRGYALAAAVSEDISEITLKKEDFYDITELYHAVDAQDGGAEPVYIEKSLGGGRYLLRAPPKRGYQPRKTRVTALWRTAGGDIPVPHDTEIIYTMSNGKLLREKAF